MKFEDHLKRDIDMFNQPFPKVHKALDKSFKEDSHGHRKNTHYLEWVLTKWGVGEWSLPQLRSAIQHIIDDCGKIMLEEDWMTADELIKKERDTP